MGKDRFPLYSVIAGLPTLFLGKMPLPFHRDAVLETGLSFQ
jgi:hypothetical protein